MTHDEFKLLAKGLKAAYPSQNFLPDDYSMRLWYTLLKDVDYTLASAAAYKHKRRLDKLQDGKGLVKCQDSLKRLIIPARHILFD